MEQLLVALDVDTVAEARGHGRSAARRRRRLQASAAGCSPAEGPAFVEELAPRGDRVFLDLKFHDIPNTVAGADRGGDPAGRLDGQRPRVGRHAR